MSKEIALKELATLRQSKTYPNYHSISEYANGAYECDYVSPYSKSAHNVDCDVFIILQDWSSDSSLKGSVSQEIVDRGFTLKKVRTNTNLINLLKSQLKLELKETYTTNLFPYIKKGNISSYIPNKDMDRAASEFTLPMLNIIEPQIAIALGMKTYNALRRCCSLKNVSCMQEAVDSPFLYNKTKIYFQTHPSQRSQNLRNKNNKNQVNLDWKSMADYLNK